MEQLCRLGSLNWLEQQGVVPLAEALAWQLEQGQAGATVLAMAHGKQLLGLLAVRDALRPDAAAAVQRLKQRGYGLGILSGDRQGPVRQLAGELGFEPEQLGWGLSPAQKLAKLESAAAPVAMVGDGLNDAPALAAANLGIAVGTGTQIAQDSADLVVLGDRLMAVPQALELAQRCMAKVRQNLVWAFGYNLLVLPLAAGVLLVDCKADAAKGNHGNGRERQVVAINATLTRDIAVKIGTEVCTLRRLKPVEVTTETEGGFISVKDEGTFDADASLEAAKVEGEKKELLVLNMEDPRARWVVFFQDPEGKLKAVEFAAGGSAVVLEDR
jgi:soluble P-type ATPase